MKNKITRREFVKTSSLATTGLILGCSVNNQFDIIIKNGFLVDGISNNPIKKDIGILGDKVLAIDNLSSASADKIIDAKEMIVSPGFIDIHTHTDVELLVNPNAESKIYQGVTTEVGGNCGSSPFPLNDEDFQSYDKNLFEKYGINASWKTTKEFLDFFEKNKSSINFITFTGHGDLRAYVVGKNDIEPTPEQLKKMQYILEESMEFGSFGLSTGLEYSPSSYAQTEELIELSKIVTKNNGVYASHIRNEDDRVEEAVEEALRICKEAGVSTQISHLKAGHPANWHKVDSLLKIITSASNSGLPAAMDRYPYIAYSTGLSTFLPLWSRQGNTDDLIKVLNDKSAINKIKEFAERKGNRIGGWEKVVISRCQTDKNKIWEGKSIQESSEISGKSPFDFIKDVIIEERNRVGIVGFAMSEENLKKILSHPLTMIGSDGNAYAPYGKLSAGKPHPRAYGTFPRVLGKYSRDEKLFDISTAVKKMTSMPANKLGLKNRGTIQKGSYADIVVFNPNTINDTATFVEPHKLAVGIEYVLVNGKITIKGGKHTNQRSGRVLRHTG